MCMCMRVDVRACACVCVRGMCGVDVDPVVPYNVLCVRMAVTNDCYLNSRVEPHRERLGRCYDPGKGALACPLWAGDPVGSAV